MLFGDRPKDPKVMMRLGMAALVVSILWPRFIPVTGSMSVDVIDGIKGSLLGIALGFLIWGARLGGFQRR
jgi:hypothetical protein